PHLIKIPEDRFRHLTINSPIVVDRADSIKSIGQLQAILVVSAENKTVVDGAVRTLACRRLGRDVWWLDEKDGKLLFSDPRMRRVAEFQANVSRTDFTPAELAVAITEIDTIMREIYGSGSKPGPKGPVEVWTQESTAKKLGYRSKATISTAILIAKALPSIPELANAETMSAAYKIVKETARNEALKELSTRPIAFEDPEIKNPQDFFGQKIILGDCVEKMKGLAHSICNLFITDPPFGEDLDIVIQRKGETKAGTDSTYRDNPEAVLNTLHAVIQEMARVGRPMCQVVMFCSESNWHILRDWFNEVGFSVYERTLLWVKAQKEPFKLYGGRTMNPVVTPASSYEMALYAWRGPVTLAKPGCNNVFIHPPISSNRKFHIAQKPVALLQDIINIFLHPETNPLLIDPFCGSGSTLIAARRCGIKQYYGFEISEELRERAVAHLINSWKDEHTLVEEFELLPEEGDAQEEAAAQ